MSQNLPHGIIDQQHLNRKNDYLFRISIKCLVEDDKGKVLVVKESARTWWDLPGGGMDHNESIKDAIARELHEEVKLKGDFTYRVVMAEEPGFLKYANVWQMRLVFKVTPMVMEFEAGEDASEMTFIDPEELKQSDNSVERKIYEYSLAAKLC